MRILRPIVVVALLAIAWAAFSAPPSDEDIIVHVQKHGESIVVDVDFLVEATLPETWSVMTDYDHMAQFISDLQYSSIISRVGNTLTVAQRGKASRGLFTISFENVREIVLTPQHEVRSRMISGDLESSDFTTRVIDHGVATEIINHGELVPKIWVPPIIGPAVIEAETRKRFQELRAEILRRKATTAAASQTP